MAELALGAIAVVGAVVLLIGLLALLDSIGPALVGGGLVAAFVALAGDVGDALTRGSFHAPPQWTLIVGGVGFGCVFFGIIGSDPDA